MELFPVIVATNSSSLVITTIAAIQFALSSYRLISVVALAAFLLELYQFQAASYQQETFFALLNVLMMMRVIVNWRKFKPR